MTDKETERARGKDKQTETKTEEMGRGEWICWLCHLQETFTLSVNDWFGASASTLVSYLINSGYNPFLQWLDWFIRWNISNFNQSKITSSIDAEVQCNRALRVRLPQASASMLRQLCNDAPEWVCNPFSSVSIDFNENRIEQSARSVDTDARCKRTLILFNDKISQTVFNFSSASAWD